MTVLRLIEIFRVENIRVRVIVVDSKELGLYINIANLKGDEKLIKKYGNLKVIDYYFDGKLNIYARCGN